MSAELAAYYWGLGTGVVSVLVAWYILTYDRRHK